MNCSKCGKDKVNYVIVVNSMAAGNSKFICLDCMKQTKLLTGEYYLR